MSTPKEVVQALKDNRQITVVRVQEVPGSGVEFLCRLANVTTDNWNLLAMHLLKQSNDRFMFRVHRTLVLQEQQGLDPKLVEGGSIQCWGGKVALNMLLAAVASAPKPAPKQVEVAVLANAQFYAPTKTGGGAYPASQAGFIPTPLAMQGPGGVVR